ncbi:MAG: hypothetical protein ACPG77_19145 [Nannocystaceae bacterium]
MGDFINFYLSGGSFNHYVTIGFGVAVAALFFYKRGGGSKWLGTCERALMACIGLGLLGVLCGLIDVGAAVPTVPAVDAARATAAGNAIAVIPLIWALLGSIPLWAVCSVFRHREKA